MKKYGLFIFLMTVLTTTNLTAQTLKGHIEDTKGNRIAFATIYIKELTQGVTATEAGEFEMTIPAGTYTCIFRSMGFEMISETIAITKQSKPVTIVLPEKVYALSAARVSASGEDPAYGIMRKAIGMAPYYDQLIKEYIADLYLKGSFKVGAIKGLVGLAMDNDAKKALSNSSGIVESVNEIHFTAPNKYEQRVKSQKQAFSFDIKKLGFGDINDIDIGLMLVNIYNPNMKILSTQSFSNYKFKYEGDFEENGRLINRIKVIPKYKRDELYSGYIYIVEKEWCVHSFDLTTKLSSLGLQFRLEQHYGEVKDKLFLPVSSLAALNGKVMGIEISGKYNNSIKYSLVVPNEKLMKAETKPAETIAQQPKKKNPKKVKKEEELAKIMKKEDLSSSDMRKAAKIQKELVKIVNDENKAERGEKKSLEVTNDYKFVKDSSAATRSAAYWDSIRPVPLVKEELVTFHKQDSINLVRAGLAADTTAQGKKKRTTELIIGLLTDGHTFRIDSTLSITYDGLVNINASTFNTVDGVVFGQSGSLTKRFAADRRLTLNAAAAYAFSRKTVLWKVGLRHSYWPNRRASWSIEGGHQTVDFAEPYGIGRINDYSSLIWRVNYSTFYDSRYLTLLNTIDVANGLTLYAEAKYANNRQETNHCDYSFFYKDSRDYRPNIPRNAQVESDSTLIADNVSFTTNIALSYTPQYYYRMRGNRKYMLYSNYPTFTLRWQHGWPSVFNSNASFDWLSFNIQQGINTSLDSRFSYSLTGGVFFNKENVTFANFRHFNSNEAGVSFSTILQPYQLLPSYTYSTNDWYVSANAAYKSRYLALKYIPFLANTLMNESLSVSYLLTPQMKHYTEIGYGLTDFYFFGDIGVFVGFEGTSYYSWGVRAAINLNSFK